MRSTTAGVTQLPWSGLVDFTAHNSSVDGVLPSQPWRVTSMTSSGQVDAAINPQLFWEGIGALGGGDVNIEAGGSVYDLTTIVETSLASTTAQVPGRDPTEVLMTWGGGNLAIQAAGDILGNRADVASGLLGMIAGGNIGNAAADETRVRIDDTVVNLTAGGDLQIGGIKQLDGFYSDYSALNLTADGSVTVTNTQQVSDATHLAAYAVYPGSLSVSALTGDVELRTFLLPPGESVGPQDNPNSPKAILMAPSPVGQLSILAGGDIDPMRLAMLDMDPNFLPGLFTLGGNIVIRPSSGIFVTLPNSAYQWGSVGFPSVTSAMSDSRRRRQHASTPTHLNDPDPVYLYAGGDIGNDEVGVTLSLPKQARVYAGRDILNMTFMGQNLAESDITRIVAGRDIAGTIALADADDPNVGINPTLRGNTFILGGPGDLMLEAGRNLGPFLNSADIFDPTTRNGPVPLLHYAGGVVAVGNEWNPYLEPESANITVQFGVAKGADYAALREAYVAPGTEANALGDYGAKLVAWMKEHAADTLTSEFGSTDIDATQAYAAFLKLPELRQRLFLTDVVYFDELRAPAVQDGPSYLKYSRGYAAVNTLFPASLGYTANGLEGGAKSDAIVHTGDMDLRLATIETLYGGNINILGPGGRVLAGSVVATAQQAARAQLCGLRSL